MVKLLSNDTHEAVSPDQGEDHAESVLKLALIHSEGMYEIGEE